ncbi:hypothetical protein D9M69_563920 [compost metagenome]
MEAPFLGVGVIFSVISSLLALSLEEPIDISKVPLELNLSALNGVDAVALLMGLDQPP